MRIAFFGKSKRHTRTTTYIARALEREGHQLWWVNERKRARLLGRRAAHAPDAARARALPARAGADPRERRAARDLRGRGRARAHGPLHAGLLEPAARRARRWRSPGVSTCCSRSRPGRSRTSWRRACAARSSWPRPAIPRRIVPPGARAPASCRTSPSSARPMPARRGSPRARPSSQRCAGASTRACTGAAGSRWGSRLDARTCIRASIVKSVPPRRSFSGVTGPRIAPATPRTAPGSRSAAAASC